MLYLVLAYLLISLISLFAGIIFYDFLFPPKGPDSSHKPLFFYVITGFIVLTGLTQWVVLFFPVNSITIFFVLLPVIVISVLIKEKIGARLIHFHKNYKSQPALIKIPLVVCLFMILVLNAGPTFMDDTQSYHIQMVKWIQEYGTVPGLANLHFRYGFNSSWFISMGLLLPAFKGINTYLALNGLISCWFCIYLFQKISLFLTSRSTPNSLHIAYGALFLLITGLLAWPMIRGNATNTNYDFITVCCILILFIETTAASRFHLASEWTIWPCYLFTVRIINGALLLLVIPVLWQCIKNKKWKTMLPFFAMGLLLIAPFLIRNILLSGYPLFPALQLDLFSPDWKADKEIAIQTVEFIKYYNRISDYYQPISETKLLSFPDWIPKWFHFLSTYNKFIVVISLMAYMICLFKWKTLRQKTNTFSLLFLLVLGAQLLSWFWLAPDPRFAYGALLCSLFLLFFLFPFSFLPVFKNTTVVKLLIVIVTVACLLYTVQKTAYGSLYHNWILPRNLPVPPFREVNLDRIKLKIPAKLPGNWNARCYDLPLPCLYEIDPRLRPRGKKIEDGFRLEH